MWDAKIRIYYEDSYQDHRVRGSRNLVNREILKLYLREIPSVTGCSSVANLR